MIPAGGQPTPDPGLMAVLHGLQQGPQPTGQLANLSMTNLLQGLGSQGQSLSTMSPALVGQVSPFLRNMVGGAGARAPGDVNGSY